MHAARLSTPFSLLAPAQPAANRGGINKPLRHFIPPLLLRAGPHFFFAAIDAAKRPVDVITAMHEIRRAVTVVRRQQSLVHRRTEHGTKPDFGLFAVRPNLGCRAFGPELGALLFAALHLQLAGSIWVSVIEKPRAAQQGANGMTANITLK